MIELNEDEEKVYIAIVREGITTVEDISRRVGVSVGRVKEMIENLSSKGFITVLSSKPMKQWTIL